MFKKFYIISFIIMLLGLSSIFFVTVKVVKDYEQPGSLEVEHVKQDIVDFAKNSLSEILSSEIGS